MRIDIHTPAEVTESARALQLANQRRLADRQADGWLERDTRRALDRSQSLVDDPASRRAGNDPWRGAVPEFEPVPEVRSRRFGKGILISGAGSYTGGKLKARSSPFQDVYFSNWGKHYSGYMVNGDVVVVPTPFMTEWKGYYQGPSFDSGGIGGTDFIVAESKPPSQLQPPMWLGTAPGGYTNFDQGQIFGETAPMVLYGGGAGATGADAWAFASNFDPDHPEFARFDLTNAYSEVSVDEAKNKLAYPALKIKGGPGTGSAALPPLQNPMAAAKNYNQFTFEAICAAGGATLSISFNNMGLGLLSNGYYGLMIRSARNQSDQTTNVATTGGFVDPSLGPLHHYAITVNNGNAFFHVDGKLIDTYSLDDDFWTYTNFYAGAAFKAGDFPIMMRATVGYNFVQQETVTWAEGSVTIGSYPGHPVEEPIGCWFWIAMYSETQTLPGSPPAAIQSLRFTPRALYPAHDTVVPSIITSLA